MKTRLAVGVASFALSLLLLAVSGTSRAQNLFVCDYGNHSIEEFNSSGVGKVFAPSFTSGLSFPKGLAFDSAGNLYVINEGQTIVKFTSSGGVLSSDGTVFASTGLGNQSGLAFEPVPEPATWAMVAMGIGAVVSGLRVRRR